MSFLLFVCRLSVALHLSIFDLRLEKFPHFLFKFVYSVMLLLLLLNAENRMVKRCLYKYLNGNFNSISGHTYTIHIQERIAIEISIRSTRKTQSNWLWPWWVLASQRINSDHWMKFNWYWILCILHKRKLLCECVCVCAWGDVTSDDYICKTTQTRKHIVMWVDVMRAYPFS